MVRASFNQAPSLIYAITIIANCLPASVAHLSVSWTPLGGGRRPGRYFPGTGTVLHLAALDREFIPERGDAVQVRRQAHIDHGIDEEGKQRRGVQYEDRDV